MSPTVHVIRHALIEYYDGNAELVDRLLSDHRGDIRHEAAEEIRTELPDPNPLASIFKPYVGTLAANLIDPEDQS